jgi:uncharacterized surface protein with fasciclin (FAS1) repeats
LHTTCALALGAISGAASAHVCMKKPYGKSYMTPMHPHAMHGYSGAMKPYGYPKQAYRGPAYTEESASNAGEHGVQQENQAAPNSTAAPAHGADIVATATAAGNFNTLIKAVVAADLYDTLRADGPFTLFAPTDAAFAKLPDGMLEGLLTDKETLVAVLGYHLVPGRLTAADLLQQREFETVQGQILSIEELSVVTADIDTANGIVHVIDSVVMPSL